MGAFKDWSQKSIFEAVGKPRSIFSRQLYLHYTDALHISLVEYISYLSKSNYTKSSVLFCLIPSLLVAIESIISHNDNVTTVLWSIYYSLVTFFGLHVSKESWYRFLGISDHINRLLSSEQRDRILNYIFSTIARPVQIIVLLAGGIVSISLLLYSSSFLDRFLTYSTTNYIQIFITGGLSSLMIYFLWLAPNFIRRLFNMGRLKLLFIYPGDTPAIKEISYLVSSITRFTMTGAVLIIAPLFYYLIKAHAANETIPDGFFYLITTVSTISFLIIASLGALSQFWLAKIILKEKDYLLQDMGKNIDKHKAAILKGSHKDAQELDAYLMLYEKIRKIKIGAISIRIILENLFRLAITLTPMALQFVISR